MCGIIGYTGHRPAIPAIVEGLRRLEYRGYDSAGVAYEAPQGLHGIVLLHPDATGRVHLEVRWAPLWTPLLAFAWFAVLGAMRGEGAITGPLSAMLAGAMLYAYFVSSTRAVRTLRLGLADAVGEAPRS